jgi:enamine deaminase RidA (YjgF/YER057c/UK114 family)
MKQRRNFLKSAVQLGAGGAMAAMAAAAATADGRVKSPGGYRLGNLYFSSGLTGVRPEARKDPLAFGGDIKEQTKRILEAHKKNLESMGSSLANVLKVTAFLADVKTEKGAFNEAYAEFFPKDAPARTALGAEFPDTATRVEIELVAYVP